MNLRNRCAWQFWRITMAQNPNTEARSLTKYLIGWLEESRRIATRFEKTAINFGGMVRWRSFTAIFACAPLEEKQDTV